MMNKLRVFYGLLSILTLALAMCIYILFRDMNNMIFFTLLQKTEFTETIFIQLESTVFSYILKYNLPDMLWFLSGILLLRFIWYFHCKIQNVYIFCFYGIGIVFELSQLSKNIIGTFDSFDLFFMGFGAFVEGLIYNISVKRSLA